MTPNDPLRKYVDAGSALLDRSRKNAEGLAGMIRKEISQQLSSLGFATKQDVEQLEARIEGRLAAMAPQPATKAARKPPGTKAARKPPATA